MKEQVDPEESNQWPVFTIKQYFVTRADGYALANPLLKDYEGRCILRGKVEVDEDDKMWRAYQGYRPT